jgi:hypothetical protein
MSFSAKIRKIVRSPFADLFTRLENIQMGVGRIESRQLNNREYRHPGDYEFKVFSEWGEDGLIQFLIHRVQIPGMSFVEFGVQDYLESNTRFLLQNNNWRGMVIDCSLAAIAAIRNSSLFRRFDLRAVHAFVDRENINSLLSANQMTGDIGLLSIDIDGNDYWVWDAIECIHPRIVICEYNSLFGPSACITIPYDSKFDRMRAHYSGLYFGASIAALARLGESKGYSLIASNLNGSNLFFVRRDVQGELTPCSPEQAYARCNFRQSRDIDGRLTFLDFEGSVGLIADLPVIDPESQRVMPLREVRL